MRLLVSLLCVVFVIGLCLAEPAAAKGRKGNGGGGRKWTTQRHEHHPGGHRHEWTQKSPTPAKEKVAKEHKHHENKQLKHQEKLGKHDSQPLPEDVGDGTTEPYNKKQKQLLIEQRNRDKRLAQAQHLREIAERNGNANLAANADRMEAFAHDHYARRVSQLEKFGVTDPLLNPDGGVLDPLDPDGGILDPLDPNGGVLEPVEQGPVSSLVERWLPWQW